MYRRINNCSAPYYMLKKFGVLSSQKRFLRAWFLVVLSRKQSLRVHDSDHAKASLIISQTEEEGNNAHCWERVGGMEDKGEESSVVRGE